MHKKNIGILTWHYYSNFGSTLQAYALQTLILSIGYNVKILNYRNLKFGNPKSLSSKFKIILSSFPEWIRNIKKFQKYKLNSIRFRRKFLNETNIFVDNEGFNKIVSNKFDAVVFGSDQIWAPNVFNPIYMGIGLSSNVLMVSYAASIGLTHLPRELIETYRNQLKKFHAISVREDEGKDLLESIGVHPVTVVLDPTLMLDITAYRKLERPVEIPSEPFIFCYFLNAKHSYRVIVEEYAFKHGLKIVGISDNPNDEKWMFTLENISADQFLWIISRANTVFTDSYHGSIFSLLYHKNLYIFKRFSESDAISQNSRIRRLCNLFNLNERLLHSGSVADITPIDYEDFEKILKRERIYSKNFLTKVLP